MKKFILFILLCSPLVLDAQAKYPILKRDTLFISEHDFYYKGGKIKTLRGTLPNGDFKFIFSSPLSFSSIMGATQRDPMAGVTHWKSMAAGYNLTIHSIRKDGSKKSGDKYHLVVTGENSFKWWVDIQNAVESGEVASNAPETHTTATTTSVADEIKKLKDLLDAGAITHDEYDTQKKKLLGQ